MCISLGVSMTRAQDFGSSLNNAMGLNECLKDFAMTVQKSNDVQHTDVIYGRLLAFRIV